MRCFLKLYLYFRTKNTANVHFIVILNPNLNGAFYIFTVSNYQLVTEQNLFNYIIHRR